MQKQRERPGYIQLKRRLEKIGFEGDPYPCRHRHRYIAKFTNEDDFCHVQTQGSWMIGDNYLKIRLWTSNFNPC
ncbi:hypothetical protein V2J09_023093 [Rumex salicifolius]